VEASRSKKTCIPLASFTLSGSLTWA